MARKGLGFDMATQTHEPKNCKLQVLIRRPKGYFSKAEKDLARAAGQDKMIDSDQYGCVMLRLVDESGNATDAYFFHGLDTRTFGEGEDAITIPAFSKGATFTPAGFPLQQHDITMGAGLIELLPLDGAVSASSHPRYHDMCEFKISRNTYDELHNALGQPYSSYHVLFQNCAHYALDHLKKQGIVLHSGFLTTPKNVAKKLLKQNIEDHQHTFGTTFFSSGTIQLLLGKNKSEDAPKTTTFTERVHQKWSSKNDRTP